MLEFVGEQAIERIVETDLAIPSLALSHACALPLERSRWHALQSRLVLVRCLPNSCADRAPRCPES